MYSIYLVEDDDNIRIGLGKYLDWSSLDIRLAGSASNGEDALREIRQTQADIVLTDVMMPGMTGLEMAQRLRESGWNGALVFLSAYGDSQKLQTALRIHAADYVLKPFDEDDIRDAMRRAKEKLHEREQYTHMQRTQRWLKVIQGEADERQGVGEQYAVTLICGDEKTDAVAERLRGMDGILWADKTSEREVIAVWIFSGDMRGIEKQTESIAAEYPMLAMATSQGIAQTWRIPAALMRLREKLAHGNVVLGGGNAHSMPTERIAQWILEQMRTAQDENWVQKRQTEILQMLNSSDVRRLRDLQDKSIALAQTLASALGTGKLSDVCEKWRKHMSMMLMGCDRADKALEILISGIQALHTLTMENRESNDAYAQICAAVDGHLKEVNLYWIMEQTGLTKWTVAKVIRNECGSTVNAWIQKLRIQAAAKLLLETNMKVYEIADTVGYSTVDYFTTVFRNGMHVTPEQYRIKNSEG